MAKDKASQDLIEIKRDAQNLLAQIAEATKTIQAAAVNYNIIVEPLTKRYSDFTADMKNRIAGYEKDLNALMKKNQQVLFSETDIVNLLHGSLIRNEGKKVSIPRNALESCETQGFNEVIVIEKSLDRAAIGKWPDSKLMLIGAKRSDVTEFKYDLKPITIKEK